MKLLQVITLLTLLTSVLATVSNINLAPSGPYPPISTKNGIIVSTILLIYMLFGETGYLPFRFKGRKKRFLDNQLDDPLLLKNKNAVLELIRSIDRQNCLLRYLCELEASRSEAEKNNLALDPRIEEDLFLLKVASRKMHPAELMREDPGSPALPFEVAIFTGSEGTDSCASVFQACPYNMTTMQNVMGDYMSHKIF